MIHGKAHSGFAPSLHSLDTFCSVLLRRRALGHYISSSFPSGTHGTQTGASTENILLISFSLSPQLCLSSGILFILRHILPKETEQGCALGITAILLSSEDILFLIILSFWNMWVYSPRVKGKKTQQCLCIFLHGMITNCTYCLDCK